MDQNNVGFLLPLWIFGAPIVGGIINLIMTMNVKTYSTATGSKAMPAT